MVEKKMDEKTQNLKLEELKLYLQQWHHHAALAWNRFASFTTLLAIGTARVTFWYLFSWKNVY